MCRVRAARVIPGTAVTQVAPGAVVLAAPGERFKCIRPVLDGRVFFGADRGVLAGVALLTRGIRGIRGMRALRLLRCPKRGPQVMGGTRVMAVLAVQVGVTPALRGTAGLFLFFAA